jgi:flagellar biosynthesis/type III secretory pathway protein FliH
MAEVLQATELQPRAVRVPAPGDLDPLLTDAMHAAYEEGHVAGFARGRDVGRAELELVADQLTTRMAAAVAAFPAACVQARAALRYELTEVAEIILSAALGHDLDLAARGLVERLASAIERLDDAPLTISVHPDARDEIAALVAVAGVGVPIGDVVADSTLAWGEARIDGEWGRAELTWPRLIEAARLAVLELDSEGSDGEGRLNS